MHVQWTRRLAGVAGLVCSLLFALPAHAVPAFARQTGMPCSSCHVGSFGPQLTEFGRTFKIGGYTLGDAPDFQPFSAMAVASYLHTATDVPGTGFDGNDNSKLEEASLFFAGRITDGLGAFVQVTYDGIGHHIALDNTDIRFAKDFTLDDHHVVGGFSLNNNPTVQDPWNTTPTWGFPFTSAALMPAPSAGVQIDDALGGQVYGLTAYALIDEMFYVEAGGYRSMSKSLLDTLGEDVGDQVAGFAPYWRLAVQKTIDDNYLSAGFFGFYAPLYPGFDRSNGKDRYTDYGFDASWQRPFGEDTLTVNTTYIHEHQSLRASFLAGDAALPKGSLNTFKVNGTFNFESEFGVSAGVFDTWGSHDAVRFAPNPIDGSANGSPNSSGYILQADWTPFATDSPSTYMNLRLGIQYTGYTKFNGRSSNYDGFGRDASDNNAVEVFAWVAF